MRRSRREGIRERKNRVFKNRILKNRKGDSLPGQEEERILRERNFTVKQWFNQKFLGFL